MLLSLCLEVHIPLIRKSVDLALNFNKNAFQWDAYRPLQWPSRGRGVSAWGLCVCLGRGSVYLAGVCLGGLPREGGVCLRGSA